MPALGRSARRRRHGLWLVLLAASAVWAGVRIVQLERQPSTGHFVKYTAHAAEILSGRVPRERLPDLSPGYLWAVTGWQALAGPGHGPLRAVQIVGVALAALLAAGTAARLGGSLAAVAAWFALLASRAALVNASEAEPEAMVILLHAAALALLAPEERPRPDLSFAAGLALGLSAVTRPSSLAWSLPLLAWWAVRKAPETSDDEARSQATTLWLAGGLIGPIVAVALVNLALTGSAVIMNPGTVLYEGMNPRSTGLQGDPPQVVKDLEPGLDRPDALHLSYRLVAARALGAPVEPGGANAFWTARSRAFVVTHPRPALALAVRKLRLAVASYDAWDLPSLAARGELLRREPWLPFGALLALAAIGLVSTRRPGIVPPALLLGATALVMVAFYVTARQRAAALPAAAVLAGVGAQNLIDSWLRGRRALAALGATAVVVVGVVLGVPGRPECEDRHAWQAHASARAALADAAQAQRGGDPGTAAALRAEAATWLVPSQAPPPPGLATAAATRLASATHAAARFDLALALMRTGAWSAAEPVLGALQDEGYRPLRGAAATSSVAYHRARCLLRLGRGTEAVLQVRRALEEAPGDPEALALAARGATLRGDSPAILLRELEALHDPFTAGLARARAAADVGDVAGASKELRWLASVLPEWRPRLASVAVELGLPLPPSVTGRESTPDAAPPRPYSPAPAG